MLREPLHGWRIKEVQKLTAIPTLSLRRNPVLFSYCHWQKDLPPKSHSCFTHQTTKFPLSTSSVATGPFAAAAAYYSGAPEPDPNTHFENLNLNVESLRESSDEERPLVFTCVSEDGTSDVYAVPKHSSQVVNKLEVHPRHKFRVAFEDAIKYGVKFMKYHFPLQVILWGKKPLSTKMLLIRETLFYRESVTIRPMMISTVEILLYLALTVAGVAALLSGIYFGWKK